jgi:hypothetical protein
VELTFCPHCRQQVTEEGHDCPSRPADYEGPVSVSVHLNRRQRRQALARAKIRLRREKK